LFKRVVLHVQAISKEALFKRVTLHVQAISKEVDAHEGGASHSFKRNV
jgi:hypothetical protein